MPKPKYYGWFGISASANNNEDAGVVPQHNAVRRRAYDQTLRQRNATLPPPQPCNWLAGDVIQRVTISPAEAERGRQQVLHYHTAAGIPYTVIIDLPPGVEHGTQIVVPGAGGPAHEGDGRGNLIVQVVVQA